MAWNEPGGGNRDPWNNKGGDQGPPDLDEVVRKLQDKMGGLFGGKGRGGGDGEGRGPVKGGASKKGIGIIVGLVEAAGTGCIPDAQKAASYIPAYGMIVLTLTLLLRPTGLLSSKKTTPTTAPSASARAICVASTPSPSRDNRGGHTSRAFMP